MEMLVRLVPGSIPLEGRVSGGRPELTTSDIAAALTGANKAGLSLLIGQICGVSHYKAVYDLFLPEAIKVATRLKWHSDKLTRARIAKLLDLVLSESLLSYKCPSCRGTKFSVMNHSMANNAKPCESCNGTGLFNNFDYLKAKHLEISDRAWRKTWREREKELKALLDRRAYQAKRKIINNLYGELDG